MKRPMSHILLHVDLSNDGDCTFARDAHGHMKMSTSQQLFQQLLSSKPFRTLTIEVWSYQALAQNHVPFFRIETAECRKSFKLDLDKKLTTRKRHFKLPFGLSMPKSKAKKPKKPAKKKPCSTTRKTLHLRTQTQRPLVGQHENIEPASKQSPTASVSTSSSSSSDSDSGSEVSEERQEDDPVMPVSETAKTEEKVATQLIAEHHEAQNAVAASSSSFAAPAKTYFNRDVGLDDVGLAVSARSVCHFCNLKIGKSEVRFSFFHSRLRPSKWVHEGCLIPLATRDQCLAQVRNRLEHLSEKQSAGSSSSSGEQQLVLTRALQRVLDSANA